MKLGKEIVTTDTPYKLPNGAVINRFSHVLPGADIAEGVMIGEHCYIGGDAQIGPRSRIQNHNNIWDGMRIESDVFIGPNCTFTNHFDPSDRFDKDFKADITRIESKATICAGVTVVAPCIIEAGAKVAAASTVLRDVKRNEFVKGVVK